MKEAILRFPSETSRRLRRAVDNVESNDITIAIAALFSPTFAGVAGWTAANKEVFATVELSTISIFSLGILIAAIKVKFDSVKSQFATKNSVENNYRPNGNHAVS